MSQLWKIIKQVILKSRDSKLLKLLVVLMQSLHYWDGDSKICISNSSIIQSPFMRNKHYFLQ